MKFLKWTVSVLFVISLLIIMLFTAVDIAAVKDKGFYRKQYVQNGTYDFIDIEEDELMRVTDVLLDYMTGKADSLYVEAEYNGGVSDFFDDIEKAHMLDVRNLFVAGINIRRVCIALAVVCLIALKALKVDMKLLLSKAYIFVTAAATVLGGITAFAISRNFTAAFYLFHEVLFTNDMWLLDIYVSKLVNMVPEPFFISLTIRIGVLFAAAVLALFAVSLIIVLRKRKTQGD